MLGCGAIGGTVAAGLVRDGHDVLVCDADPAVVAAINDDGLRIEGPVEQFTARPHAISPGELPDRIDFPVLVACKQHHTAAAAALLAGRLAGEAFVVSLQNGLPSPALAAAAGPGRVVQACVNFGADVLAPGVVMRGNRGTFKIGEIDGTPSARIDALAADIADAEATTEVMGFVWGKEAYGAMLFATAVSDLAIHEVFDDPAYHPLLLAVAREVLGQAPVRPLPLDGFDPDDLPGSLPRLADFNRRSAKSHSGIYRDLIVRRRKTETEAILGPLQGFLIRRTAELIAAIEAGTRTCCRENLDLLAAYERLDRLGRPLNAVVVGRRRAAPVCGGSPVRAARRGQGHHRGRGAADQVRQPGRPVTRPRPRTRRWSAGSARRARRCSPPRSAWSSPPASPTPGSATPATRAIRPGRRAAPRAGRPRWSPRASATWRSAPTPAARSASPPPTAASSASSRPTAWCRRTGCSRCRRAWTTWGRSPRPPPTALPCCRPSRARRRPRPAVGVPVIGVLSAQLADPSVTPEVREAVQTALDRLAAAGWQLREVKPPWLEEPQRWEEALTVIVAREAAASHAGRDTSQYAEGTRALLAFGAAVTPEQYASARAAQAELSAAVEETLAGVDALAGPTVGYCAPEQDPPFGAGDDNAEGRFTGPYNLTGHPAVSIPVPASGLPVGLQLAGRRDGDLALLELAAAAQRLLTHAPATGPGHRTAA